MSGKILNKGVREERSLNTQKRTMHHSHIVQNPIIFLHNSNTSPLLSDESEFPSLNESSGIVSSDSFATGRTLRYSDTLKSHSNSKNQSSVAECPSFKSSAVTNEYKQYGNTNLSINNPSNWRHKGNSKTTFQTNQTSSDKSQLRNSKKVDVDSNQDIPKKQPNEWFKEKSSLPKQMIHDRSGQSKERQPINTSNNSKRFNSNRGSVSSANLNSTRQSDKLPAAGNSIREAGCHDGQNDSKAKKKKRKSKVKRQVAMQSGKITVLTPEVHLKILNQTSALNIQCSKTVLTDINDEEEYPELGKVIFPSNQKDNYLKKEISLKPIKETIEMHPNVVSEEIVAINEPFVCDIVNETPATEKKGKNDTKATVHLKDPITLSFYDMLIKKNSKPKHGEIKEEANASLTAELTKMKMKKNTCHPHNLLDSSSPMIKRGKERENPKPKKPSMLKKIILSDRKARKEQFLLLKSNNVADYAADDNELAEEVITNEPNNEVVLEDNTTDENCNVASCHLDEISDKAILVSDNDDSLIDELIPMTEQINILEPAEKSSSSSSPVDNFCDKVKSNNYLDDSKLNSPVDNMSNCEKGNLLKPETVTIIAPASSSDVSLPNTLSGLINNVINKSEASDKEKAAKILLHTRNFREYCNHLISKDIDDAVYALLDDLARFQDRLHQKDPVKARMKKRMIYGVKEVKKHIKLKKLKCIIIAVDIENVESQGGLNDVLNDIKLLAADHHIPCVFALSRKVLGKVCRKPVAVSCVGVFNFEGSEANFKKLVELQAQSKADYNDIFNKLFSKLKEEETISLLKAKKEAPETLQSIRVNILNDFFMQIKSDASKSDDADLILKGCEARFN